MAGDKLEALGGPWQIGVRAETLSKTNMGRPNPGWGCIDTEHQTITGTVNFFSYKLNKAEKVKEDYYAVYGLMRHGILHQGGTYDPSANLNCVGYYANTMSLVLAIGGPGEAAGYSVWDAGPTSTVGQATSSFSIGGNLGGTVGDFNVVSGGLDASFGTSFSTPEVVLSQATVENSVRWDVRLPGVGFSSPGVPANPHPPSSAGYQWYFGVIYKTPGGIVPQLTVHPRINWEFDWTRGITNHEVTWEDTRQVDLQPPA